MVGEDDSSGAGTASGMPLRILHPERASESNSTDISPEAMQRCLEGIGFAVQQRSEHGNRLQWDDIEAFLGIEDGALAEILLTFTLSRDSPSRLGEWEAFVHHLSSAWGLSIYASDLDFAVEAKQFIRILTSTPAWRDFAANFMWDT